MILRNKVTKACDQMALMLKFFNEDLLLFTILKLLKYWKNFTLKCKSLIYKVNDVFDQIAQPKYTCSYAKYNIHTSPILGILIKGGRIACIV